MVFMSLRMDKHNRFYTNPLMHNIRFYTNSLMHNNRFYTNSLMKSYSRYLIHTH